MSNSPDFILIKFEKRGISHNQVFPEKHFLKWLLFYMVLKEETQIFIIFLYPKKIEKRRNVLKKTFEKKME